MDEKDIDDIDIFDKNRELVPFEYMNLSEKAKAGAIPADYLRKSVFNATTKESHELARSKTVYQDKNTKIQINRSLHQKHRDILSIIFTDNRGISKPKPDGSYYIKTSLYYLASCMGYEHPKNGVSNMRKLLLDLRGTNFTTTDLKNKFMIEHMLLGDSFYDERSGHYIIEIPAMTAKYHILNYAVEIPKDINRKIVSLPNGLAKLKALISYIIANRALVNGISFEKICDHLDITVNSRKSEFLKEIRENKKILSEFNIFFNEDTKIIKYEQLPTINFHAGISASTISRQLTMNLENEQEQEGGLSKEEINYKKKILAFAGNQTIEIYGTKYNFSSLERDSESGSITVIATLLDKTFTFKTLHNKYEDIYNIFFIPK